MLNSAWRHRREDHRCEEISPCPYRGQILLEKRRFSNVNQIDEEFDPGSDDDEDSDTTEDSEGEDLAGEPDSPPMALAESSAAEEGKHSAATNYRPATAETEQSVREFNCCCVIS